MQTSNFIYFRFFHSEKSRAKVAKKLFGRKMNNTRIEQLKKFLGQNSNDSFVLYALAIEYVNIGDDETALDYFKKILQHHPDYTGLYYHLGKLYERMRRKELAEETYREG